MAMTKSYHTVNGRILGETSSGVRTDYLTDALGSVTATADQNAQVVNTYRYKPYGGQLAKTGSGPDPKYRWVGAHGYRDTGRRFSDVYVRARHYGSTIGSWSSKDPMKDLGTNHYLYASCSPTTLIDPTGLQAAGELHVKILSKIRKGARVMTGTISTPRAISISPPPGVNKPVNHVDLWSNEWLTFYLAFASDTKNTQYDCGISFTCHDKPGRGRGWAAWLVGRPRGSDKIVQQRLLDIQCGERVSVTLELKAEGSRWVVICSVKGVTFRLQHGIGPPVPRFHDQVTVGASSANPKHSQAAWDVPIGTKSEWPYTDVKGEDYTVDSWLPLKVRKGTPATTNCDCIGVEKTTELSFADCGANP